MRNAKQKITRPSITTLKTAISRNSPLSGIPENELIIGVITQAADDALFDIVEGEKLTKDQRSKLTKKEINKIAQEQEDTKNGISGRAFFKTAHFRNLCHLIGMDSEFVRRIVGEYWAAKIAETKIVYYTGA